VESESKNSFWKNRPNQQNKTSISAWVVNCTKRTKMKTSELTAVFHPFLLIQCWGKQQKKEKQKRKKREYQMLKECLTRPGRVKKQQKKKKKRRKNGKKKRKEKTKKEKQKKKRKKQTNSTTNKRSKQNLGPFT
jgi:hypothetical protein